VALKKYPIFYQSIFCISLVIITSLSCYIGSSFIGYRTVALLLLVNVSILAMLFDILPVVAAAVLSALIWNFFFIPPIFTFHINNSEDTLMFFLYFFIALINAVLTIKIRKAEIRTRDKEEKEKTIQLYNTLLNSLSHELRTPIATIIVAVDNLKENKQNISLKNEYELLHQIDIASIRLNRQVENLLNMSRLETGMLQLKIDWCDTNELIYNVVQSLGIDYKQNIVFKADEYLPLFKLDSVLMEQVLHNLLHNAIMYTPDNATITISSLQHNDNCVITVSDNGPGIPEHEIPYLFDKFYRLPQSKAGGCGLGLSIIKGFVEAHNGSIKAENNINKSGVTFTLKIPASASYINNLKNE